eukprot:6461944-Amphidinium_carterae.1
MKGVSQELWQQSILHVGELSEYHNFRWGRQTLNRLDLRIDVRKIEGKGCLRGGVLLRPSCIASHRVRQRSAQY